MSNFKEQFRQLRQNTPKHIQWMLLAAAFVVVLILLTMIWGDKENKAPSDDGAIVPELILNPDTPIDWTETEIGDEKSQTVSVSATESVKILGMDYTPVEGFHCASTCAQQGIIDTVVSCRLDFEYKPTVETSATESTVSIKWKNAKDKDALDEVTQITVALGTAAVEIPEPIVIPEPEPKPEPKPEPEPEPEPDPNPIDDAINEIAPPLPVGIIEPEPQPTPEACSKFAFPGYNSVGRQIGWVKPSGGAFYFHPFSDKTCSEPTGVYNPDNGIITDIDDSSIKIGTDAEHIGYTMFNNGALPQLSNIPAIKPVIRAEQYTGAVETMEVGGSAGRLFGDKDSDRPSAFRLRKADKEKQNKTYLGSSGSPLLPSQPYDRQFILRQYKPIPATIVSEIRADPETLRNSFLPVRATVDRNVYSDAGRNVIIPAGTLMLGYVTGKVPGPYTTIGRMEIKWYQFVLPNGMEYNFDGGEGDPFSGDSQGRVGVPGRGSTDYLEQFFMPMLTAIVPAAVNMIAPISDAFVNQIDLDNNTVVQSGQVRSSELAKNEIITAWNQVAQKLLVDMMDNAVPPFTIPAGTRITVYSPEDLVASCGLEDGYKKCSLGYAEEEKSKRNYQKNQIGEIDYDDPSWVGQVRSFNIATCCGKNGKPISDYGNNEYCKAFDYATLVFYCQSSQYKAINNARQDAIYANQQEQFKQYDATLNEETGTVQGNQQYNQDILGLEYNADGTIKNPFEKTKESSANTESVLKCLDGTLPDANGCCTGEVYTDMGEQGFNCCPTTGGDCFPPMI